MSLFLPILLLGFVQPADQLLAPPAAPSQAQIENSAPATSPNHRNETAQSPQPQQEFKHVDPIEIYPSSTSDLCLTMRSYYFQRRDGNAPEFQGMTTCETGRDMAKRNAKQDHKPGLVPLVTPAK